MEEKILKEYVKNTETIMKNIYKELTELRQEIYFLKQRMDKYGGML